MYAWLATAPMSGTSASKSVASCFCTLVFHSRTCESAAFQSWSRAEGVPRCAAKFVVSFRKVVNKAVEDAARRRIRYWTLSSSSTEPLKLIVGVCVCVRGFLKHIRTHFSPQRLTVRKGRKGDTTKYYTLKHFSTVQ